jgi:hypothetical protein
MEHHNAPRDRERAGEGTALDQGMIRVIVTKANTGRAIPGQKNAGCNVIAMEWRGVGSERGRARVGQTAFPTLARNDFRPLL